MHACSLHVCWHNPPQGESHGLVLCPEVDCFPHHRGEGGGGLQVWACVLMFMHIEGFGGISPEEKSHG
jgi:hypothetical protein